MTPALREQRRALEDWLLASAFPLWCGPGADLEGGGFHEALTHDGAPVRADRRARVQTRQVYAYARAGTLGWGGAWSDAAEHGLEFFLRRYARGDGLYRTLVGADGRRRTDEAWIYDQAFALLAFAEAAARLPHRASLSREAHEVLAGLNGRRAPLGGFIEASPQSPYQSNPHMHLLEAALSWRELEPGGPWEALADELAELALAKFRDPGGGLHEFFAPDWSFAPGIEGRIVEPGHQFEWAWLLERWSRLRSRDDAHAAAVRLFEIGRVHGVDRTRGVAFDQMLEDFKPHRREARLWPQTERLKAALILAEAGGPDRELYLREAEAALEGLRKYLEVPIAGLWRDKMTVTGAFIEEAAPASSFYHIVCAAAELRRLTPEVSPKR